MMSSIVVAFALFVAGLVIVMYGAEYFVRGASSVAAKLGVTPFVIGLTIVAIGTSAPEVAVNVLAAARGAVELSIGNIVGSNIVDTLLGLGLAALVRPLTIHARTVWKEIPFIVLAAMMLLVLGGDCVIDRHCVANSITRGDGLVLLSFFTIFIVYTFTLSRTSDRESSEAVRTYSWLWSTVLLVGGLLALVIGGKIAVDAAVRIATLLGWSQNLIGLTIVAVGTSLPEVMTSLSAVRQGAVDLVVGGIVGTIIFNTFFALGLTALVAPLPFTRDNAMDTGVFAATTIVLFALMFVGKRHTLQRYQGIVFVGMYIAYILFALHRG